jgi:CTP synthase
LEAAGLTSSGFYEAQGLVEIVELTDRPFYLGVQYHPEYKSKPLAPHPLFSAFVAAAIEFANAANQPSPQSVEA